MLDVGEFRQREHCPAIYLCNGRTMPAGETLLMSVLLPRVIISIFSASLFPFEIIDTSAACLNTSGHHGLDRADCSQPSRGGNCSVENTQGDRVHGCRLGLGRTRFGAAPAREQEDDYCLRFQASPHTNHGRNAACVVEHSFSGQIAPG